jgi:ParB/RepB/Spo0J family partition protein
MIVTAEVIDLPVVRIKPDPKNLRKIFDQEEISALGRNIREIGQLEPIKVFPNGDGTFDLHDGERRWRAALAEDLVSLKAIVEERPDDETLVLKKISRLLQTKGLSKQEEVLAIEESLEELGIRHDSDKWGQYGDRLGGDVNKIRERMRVADLPPKLREEFERGSLPYTVAQSVGRITTAAKQAEAAEFIVSNNVSGRFVTTRLIPMVLQHPELPMPAIYDLARHEEKWRYAKPVTKLRIEQSLADLTDDLIDSFIKSEQALEEAAAHGQIEEISADPFHRDRLLYSINRLLDVLKGFMKSYDAHFSSGEGGDEVESHRQRLLPASQHAKPVSD